MVIITMVIWCCCPNRSYMCTGNHLFSQILFNLMWINKIVNFVSCTSVFATNRLISFMISLDQNSMIYWFNVKTFCVWCKLISFMYHKINLLVICNLQKWIFSIMFFSSFISKNLLIVKDSHNYVLEIPTIIYHKNSLQNIGLLQSSWHHFIVSSTLQNPKV
jgi:hypothetical protein